MPREPPVTSATFFANFDMDLLLIFCEQFTTSQDSTDCDLARIRQTSYRMCDSRN
jgi:hypothetical protein